MTARRPLRLARAAIAATLALLLLATPLLANGGTVRLSRVPIGPWLVSTYTSPTPLRTGEVDISVMVQDSAGSVLLDIPVLVEAVPVGFDAATIRHGGTTRQATNRLFRAAKFPVPVAGEWEFRVFVGGDAGGMESFRVELTDPTILDRPYLLALMVLLPLILVGWLMAGRNGADDDDDDGPRRRRQSRMAATT